MAIYSRRTVGLSVHALVIVVLQHEPAREVIRQCHNCPDVVRAVRAYGVCSYVWDVAADVACDIHGLGAHRAILVVVVVSS